MFGRRSRRRTPTGCRSDDFAREAVKAITERTTYRVIPWQMGVLAKIMRLIPNSLFDRILANRKQKPRVTTPKA